MANANRTSPAPVRTGTGGHTPGPWNIDTSRQPDSFIEIYSGSVLVADVPIENPVADAHLITAAPELLAVSKFVLSRIPATDLSSKKYLEDAIAKAEGKA